MQRLIDHERLMELATDLSILLDQAHEYADMGRPFPTYGVNNLIELLGPLVDRAREVAGMRRYERDEEGD